MPGELAGKVLFLAGVGPQIGAATARIAAREGAKVALAARGSEFTADLAAEIAERGGHALAATCDLTDHSSLPEAIDRTAESLGPIDCVFYNAGFYDNEHDSLEASAMSARPARAAVSLPSPASPKSARVAVFDCCRVTVR